MLGRWAQRGGKKQQRTPSTRSLLGAFWVLFGQNFPPLSPGFGQKSAGLCCHLLLEPRGRRLRARPSFWGNPASRRTPFSGFPTLLGSLKLTPAPSFPSSPPRHHELPLNPAGLLPAGSALPPPTPSGARWRRCRGPPGAFGRLLPSGPPAALRRGRNPEPEAAQSPPQPPGRGSGARQRLPPPPAARQPLQGKKKNFGDPPLSEVATPEGARGNLCASFLASASAPRSFSPSTT